MNRTTKLLSILIIVSYGLATDNTDGKSETVAIDKTPFADIIDDQAVESVTRNETIAPVDIEKIKTAREGISMAKKARAAQLLQKHKSPKPPAIVSQNTERLSKERQIEAEIKKSHNRGSLFEKFGEAFRKKYKTVTLRSEDGKRALKFPTNTKTN